MTSVNIHNISNERLEVRQYVVNFTFFALFGCTPGGPSNGGGGGKDVT